jgi:hypothetical protein
MENKMILPIEKVEKQIFTIPSGKAKLIWNGYGWDKVTSISEDATGTKLNFNVNTNKEIPLGNVDGYNFIFSFSQSPIEGSEHIWLNGLLQKSGEDYDYTIYKDSIYFVEPPFKGSTIVCTYTTQKSLEKQNEIARKISSRFFAAEREIEIGKEMVYLNGLLQIEGEDADYIIDSNIIKFREILSETDVVIISYQSI